MKKLLVLALFLSMTLPAAAFATETSHDNLIPKDKVIEGNYYLASDNPTVLGTVNGDLVVFGGNVVISGDVKNDLFVAGGNVTVNGNIGDDVRVFGGTINLNGKVGGEAILMGGTVVVGSTAQVGKDLTVGSGNPQVDKEAKVLGQTTILKNEDVKKANEDKGFVNRMLAGGWLYGQVIGVLAMMLFGLILFNILPKYMKRESRYGADSKNFWKSVGLGLAALIVIPVAAIICFVTQIGVIVGFVLIFAYILLILTTVTFSGFIFANIARQLIEKNDKAEIDLPWAMGGILVLHLLTMVPFIGWLISLVFFLLSMGTIISCKYIYLKESK